MRISGILLVCSLAACQPLYGTAPQRLAAPKPVPRPKTLEPDPTATPKIAYVEQCDVDFRRNPANVRRDRNAATSHVATGNSQLARAATEAEPTVRATLVVKSIEDYERALASDPYDPEATLELARAYDQLRRKGCALALLRRLDEFAQHKTFAKAANPHVRRVFDNPAWFRDYRRDAVGALGGAAPAPAPTKP